MHIHDCVCHKQLYIQHYISNVLSVGMAPGWPWVSTGIGNMGGDDHHTLSIGGFRTNQPNFNDAQQTHFTLDYCMTALEDFLISNKHLPHKLLAHHHHATIPT